MCFWFVHGVELFVFGSVYVSVICVSLCCVFAFCLYMYARNFVVGGGVLCLCYVCVLCCV